MQIHESCTVYSHYLDSGIILSQPKFDPSSANDKVINGRQFEFAHVIKLIMCILLTKSCFWTEQKNISTYAGIPANESQLYIFFFK